MNASDHHDIERLLLLMSDIGRRVSDAMATSVGDSDLVNNSVVLVLSALDLNGPMRPGALSDVTGMSSAGMTGVLDRLEQRKLVERAGGVPGDRRGVLVRLTPEGRKAIRKMTGAAAGQLEELRAFAKGLVEELSKL